MKSPHLTVVIPCYNERENLERGVLQEVADYLDKQKYSWEVIISDDASTDNSRELVKQFKHKQFRLLENPHGGKAVALKYGLAAAQGQYILFTDMDQSTPINELDNLLPFTKQQYHVIIGSRGRQRKDSPLIRQLASAVFGVVRQSLILGQIHDTQCGFKLVHRQTALDIFNQMLIFKQSGQAKGWVVAAWDVEFLYLADKYGHSIKEAKVNWQDKDQSTGKDRNISKFIRESIDMLRQIIRVKRNDLKGMYDFRSSVISSQ